MEACRIELRMTPERAVNVQAPMAHKLLCYDILDDARTVINQTPSHLFWNPRAEFAIVMDMTGKVDVSAPLPPKDFCFFMLDQARVVIEHYEGEAEKNPLLA